MPHIAFLLPDFRIGGAERVALTLINAFLARGHQVDLLLTKAKGELLPLVPSGVRVIDLGAPRLRHAIWPLARYLRRERPDALQVRMWPLTIAGILARTLARTRTRVVVSDHASLSRHYAHSRLALWMIRWTTRFFYPAADHRIVVSSGAADDLAALSGLPRDRFEVIYNPIAPPKSISTNPEVERLWGDGSPRIITVGALKEEKNQALLLRAFASLRHYPKAKLMILGEGLLRSELERLGKELGIADRVQMPGVAANPWPYLASADLFVLSSAYEGFGNVLVEAMLAGLPIVSTDCVAGPAEILDGGRYGKLVPCDDAAAMADAIEVALAATVHGEAQQRRAAEISGDHIVDEYLSLLLPEKRGSRALIR